MANRQTLVKLLREYTRCADDYCSAVSSSRKKLAGDPGKRLEAAWAALDQSLEQCGYSQWGCAQPGAMPPSKLAWLEAYAEAGMAAWILRRLQAISGPACQGPSSGVASNRAIQAAEVCWASCHQVKCLFARWMSPIVTVDFGQEWGRYGKLLSPLLDVSLLNAVAGAARTIAALARSASILSANTAASSGQGPAKQEQLAKYAALACHEMSGIASRFTFTASSVLGALLRISSSQPSPSALLASASRLTRALQSSQLLAAAATAILTYPGPDFCPALSKRFDGQGPLAVSPPQSPEGYYEIFTVAQGLYNLLAVAAPSLPACGAADALTEALSHPDVGALRMAMLESVWAHAGMEPLSEQSDEGSYGGSGSGQGGGSTSSSSGHGPSHGQWRRRLVWLQEGRTGCTGSSVDTMMTDVETQRFLEELHSDVINVALGPWQWARHGQQSGLRAIPLPCPPGRGPEEHMARLAARTAEALCRLSLVQGQGHNPYRYSTQPQWMFSPLRMARLLMPSELDLSADAPAAAVPHWAEALAWSAALHTGAVEDVVSTGGTEACRGKGTGQDGGFQSGMTPLESLQACYTSLGRQVDRDGAPGFQPGAAPGHENITARLQRAGLGSSADRALRLAFTAWEPARAPGDMALSRQQAAAALSLDPYEIVLPSYAWRLPLMSPVPAGSKPLLAGAGGAVLTLAKRAAALARMLEARAADARLPETAQYLEFDNGSGATTLALLAVVPVLTLLRQQLGILLMPAKRKGQAEGCNGAAAAAPQSDASARSGGVGTGEALLLAELEAFALRSIGRLATQAATDLARLAVGPPADVAMRDIVSKVCCSAESALLECLTHFSAAAHVPGFLAVPQLLACQPHRLLAAACKLLRARLPTTGHAPNGTSCTALATGVVQALYDLSSHPELSGRARAWLVPAGPEPLHADVQGSLAGVGLEAGELGCLEELVRSGLLPRAAPSAQADGRLLLAAACSPHPGVVLGCPQEVLASDDPDGGYLRAARHYRGSSRFGASGAAGASADDGAAGGGELQPDMGPVEAPLPPPLAVPPAALALARLRVCGNPGCCEFGGASEGALPLKQCGGCKGVRYCGEGCQSAHWRSGHKADCKAMAAAVRAAQDTPRQAL